MRNGLKRLAARLRRDIDENSARLRRDLGGNATLLVALGMPVLIGGAGLAVDTAQWYMWKRELQYAADQAAIAGAWSRAKNSTGTTYQDRARQELTANRAIVDFAAAPTISLASYNGGAANSVVVTIDATRTLPFSSIMTGAGVTVGVRSQAAFTAGQSFTSCLIATDPTASGAITIGGNASLTAGCGMAALSNSPTAVVVNGNPSIDAGWILAAGGIDDWVDLHTNAVVHENMTGLTDPFAGLSPPTNSTPRTYACSNGSTLTTANVTTTVATVYTYKRGSNLNNATTYNYTPVRASTSSVATQTAVTVANGTVNGTTSSSNVVGTRLSGNGQNTIWEVATTTTTVVTSGVVVTTTPAGAFMQPGTYASFDTRCNTTMASGIYVIDGGSFTIRSQDSLVGNGVMIVLKNGASITINGGASITLTAMTASQLESAGVSATNANRLAGMLVFEDPASPGAGASGDRINGNASTVLNGTFYLPRSQMRFAGTARVTSQCLMIASDTITIEGTADMSTFCPPGVNIDEVVATTVDTVKLVS